MLRYAQNKRSKQIQQEESINGLLEAIKESPEYLEFRKQSELLEKDPELKARVDAFRADNYRVQNECAK